MIYSFVTKNSSYHDIYSKNSTIAKYNILFKFTFNKTI